MSQPTGWDHVALIAGEGRALANRHLIDLTISGHTIYVQCRCKKMRQQRIITAYEALVAFGEHLASYSAADAAS